MIAFQQGIVQKETTTIQQILVNLSQVICQTKINTQKPSGKQANLGSSSSVFTFWSFLG
jgi:hypothetical protein